MQALVENDVSAKRSVEILSKLLPIEFSRDLGSELAAAQAA